jgi:MraZ protein
MCQTSPETNGVFSPAVFAGSHRRTLDPKKRLTFPSSWRNAIGEGGVIFVLPDPRGCLMVLTQEEMASKIQRFKNKALFDSALNTKLQAIASNSDQLMFDTQGRIRISDKLLGYAEIKEDVVLLTGFTTIEIWATEKAPSSDTVDISEYTSAVSDLGF